MELASLQTGPLDVNTYIVPLAGRAVLIVDPAACAFSGDEHSVVQYLDERDLIPVGILLTHGHFDHVCGLKELRKSFAHIPIAIHKADAECVGANSALAHEENVGELGFFEKDLLETVTALPEADFFLAEGDTLDTVFSAEYIIAAFTGDGPPDVEAVLNELSHWKVLHTPGHSRGSVCFYNSNDGILISGDTIFYQSYGRTDLRGGNEAQIKKSLVRIFEELPQDTRVFPGHGMFGFALKE